MFYPYLCRKQNGGILMKKKKQNEKKSIEAYACRCFMVVCTCECGSSSGGSATSSHLERQRLMGTNHMKGA